MSVNTDSTVAEAPKGAGHASADSSPRQLLVLSLTALGVVYGDIGTSPLYALRECFRGANPIPASAENILGVLSLIFWALVLVISIKYLIFVMRADNRGEGGILALLALLDPWKEPKARNRLALIVLGLFGAALLYGDGVITPAISVLSAVEGLRVATPALDPFVLPITILILFVLFVFQQRGTAKVGAIFGPVMILWFVTLAVLGMIGIVKEPRVLAAVNPLHAVRFFLANGWTGVLVMGAVFLVVTGGEALYADMGHFGSRPIRVAWFCCVLPALIINYFGQGALLLHHPKEVTEPFFHLAPAWALYPLIILATMATVIASQAVISGAFSLTRQAVQLGQCPRMRIVQTSSEEIGQIYIPFVNWALMIVTIALVLGFRTSSNLAAAYGVAVTTTMVITTILAFFVTRELWRWPLLLSLLVCGGFLIIDLGFFCANMLKIVDGGWFPLTAGAAVFTLMATWRRGRELLAQRLQKNQVPLEKFIHQIGTEPPQRVPGTAVFMTGYRSGVPAMLLHHLEHNKMLHEQVILLTAVTEEFPRVPAVERLEINDLGQGFSRVYVHYGFMQSPNIPVALRACEYLGLKVDLDTTTFYLGGETLIPTSHVPGMMTWRKKLFAFMSRNSLRATTFYNIPPERVMELGLQIEI
ncbi:MAG TPA: potassium transporter Kup [Desulfuromonadales bacterium]|nr:potassium transporter Kup [Desulfuromonadales bacterium]